jgi:hypothetical protein
MLGKTDPMLSFSQACHARAAEKTVAGVLALLFFETYERSGLQLLRHAWLNFDLLWAIALLMAGCAVLFF